MAAPVAPPPHVIPLSAPLAASPLMRAGMTAQPAPVEPVPTGSMRITDHSGNVRIVSPPGAESAQISAPQVAPAPTPPQQQYSAPVVIPGGPQVSGGTIQETPGIQISEASKRGRSIVQAAEDATQDARQNAEGERAKNAQRRAELSKAVDADYLAQQSKLIAEEARSNHTVDPNGFWQKRGTAGTIGGALLIGLGEFAARMPGGNGKNTAKEIIDKAVEQDIAAQERNINNSRISREQKAVRIAALREAALRNVDAQMAGAEEYAKSKGKEADLAQMRQEVLGRRLTESERLDAAAQGQVTKSTQWINRPTQVIGGGGGSATAPKAAEAAADKIVEVGGKKVVYRTAKEAEEARTRIAGLDELDQLTGQISKEAKEGGVVNALTPWTTQSDKNVSALRSAQMAAGAKALGLNERAAASPHGQMLIENMIGSNPMGIGSQIGSAVSGRSGQMAVRKTSDIIRAGIVAGGVPVNETFERDKKGEVRPAARYTGESHSAPVAPSFKKAGQ